MAIAYGDEIAILDSFKQVRGIAGMCPFLSVDSTCSIYEHRPLNCRVYPHLVNPHCINNDGHIPGDSILMGKLLNKLIEKNPQKKVYV